MADEMESSDETEREASDGSLLWMYKGGDADAAETLCRRYVSRLQGLARANFSDRLANQVDAEDIVQSVFRRFFQAVDQGKYDVPRGADLWSLLMVIGLNRVRTEELHHRAARRDMRRTLQFDEQGWAALLDAHCNAESRELMELMLEELLEPLPELYRQVVALRLENWEVEEIAQRIGRSKRSTERMLQDIRAKLQQLLEA
jgi:RNA polymerase sigma-70 factor (ECF subfamily)